MICLLWQIKYYRKLDVDRLEIIKLLSTSIMPLGILTVVVLAVILFGITTATESAGVGAGADEPKESCSPAQAVSVRTTRTPIAALTAIIPSHPQTQLISWSESQTLRLPSCQLASAK